MRNLLCLCFVFAGFLSGQESKPGTKVENFTVQDLAGAPVQLAALKGGVTVIAFIATQCPVSNAYNERMNALYKEYSAKGVKFVFINANSTEPAAEVERHAARNGFAFRVYKDAGNVVADRLGAQVTPEAIVLDKDSIVRYHGPIDDSQDQARVKEQRLRLALDALLAGKGVARAEARAFGCSIKRARKAS